MTNISMNQKYTMNFDGCSKGNPGLAGAGAVIYKNEDEIWCGTKFVGIKATNNQAEYTGLLIGLEAAIEYNIKDLHVIGDSQLVINHMTGKYKCKSVNLIDLYTKAKSLETNITNIHYEHVLREFNTRADHLSNIAVQNSSTDKASIRVSVHSTFS